LEDFFKLSLRMASLPARTGNANLIMMRIVDLPDYVCFADFYCGNSPGIPDSTGRTVSLRLLGLAAKVNETDGGRTAPTRLSVLVLLLRSRVAIVTWVIDFTELFAAAPDKAAFALMVKSKPELS
jgi:hypothetical protein